MFCSECKEECDDYTADEGIGRGEAWGVSYNDVRMEVISRCCDAPVFVALDDCSPIAYSEYKYENDCNEADYRNDLRKERLDPPFDN